MVQHGDFDVHLVDAETKNPFPEHSKDGVFYAEVEPGVEYFISVQKIRVTTHCKNSRRPTLTFTISVDGQELGYRTVIPGNVAEDKPSLLGLWSRSNGISSHKALKFAKPKYSNDGSGGGAATSRGLLMGKVRVDVYEGVNAGQLLSVDHDSARSFTAAKVDINQSRGLAEKKTLRSDAGSTVLADSQGVGYGVKTLYNKGAHLDAITLNYCAAPGLIEVGILPKPPLWEYARMVHPRRQPEEDDSSNVADVPAAKKIRIQDNREVEQFDLCASDEDN